MYNAEYVQRTSNKYLTVHPLVKETMTAFNKTCARLVNLLSIEHLNPKS